MTRRGLAVTRAHFEIPVADVLRVAERHRRYELLEVIACLGFLRFVRGREAGKGVRLR